MCVTLCFKLKQLPTDLFQRKNLARYNLHLVGGDGEQFATYLAKYYFYVLFKLFVKWGIKTQYRKNTNFLLLNYMVNFQAFGDCGILIHRRTRKENINAHPRKC